MSVGVLSTRRVKSNVSSVDPSSERNTYEGFTFETLDFTIRIGSTPTIFYFDLYLSIAYAVHYTFISQLNFNWDEYFCHPRSFSIFTL